MNLSQYDNQCIQIITVGDEIFEGICSYDHAEYNEHEYGRYEDSLQIVHFIFYESDIKKIVSLEKNESPYGKFTEAYGYLEKLIVEGDFDFLDEVLDIDEEEEHIYRILLCLEDYYNHNKLPNYLEIIPLLKRLIKYYENEQIRKKARQLIACWNQSEV